MFVKLYADKSYTEFDTKSSSFKVVWNKKIINLGLINTDYIVTISDCPSHKEKYHEITLSIPSDYLNEGQFDKIIYYIDNHTYLKIIKKHKNI